MGCVLGRFGVSEAAELCRGSALSQWVLPAPRCLPTGLAPVQRGTGSLGKLLNVIASPNGIRAPATLLLEEQRRFLALC